MSEKEKGGIVSTLCSLDEKDKHFILGYMAGVASEKQSQETESKAAGENQTA